MNALHDTLDALHKECQNVAVFEGSSVIINASIPAYESPSNVCHLKKQDTLSLSVAGRKTTHFVAIFLLHPGLHP